MNCWHCNAVLIWGSDYMYEVYGIDGDGIVSNLHCPNNDCGVETVLVYCSLDDKENGEEEEE